MFELLFYGVILLTIGLAVLFGSNTATTVLFVIILIAMALLFVRFPGITLALLGILLAIGFVLTSKERKTTHLKDSENDQLGSEEIPIHGLHNEKQQAEEKR